MNPIFRIKKFDEPNLGEYLQAGRVELNMSLENVAEKISISRRHLKALEDNELSKLPPEIYVKGFINRYCELVDLDKIKAARLYESKKLAPKKDRPVKSILSHVWFSNIFSYRNFAIIVVIIFLTTAVFYLTKSIYPMYARPSLKFILPKSCPYHTNQEKLELKGVIQPESKIWINDEESLVDKEGAFECPLFLKNGENLVRFKVENKFGRVLTEECLIYKN